ncbi:MAG: hypothetical protein PHH62_05660 [Endomicrobiaceae bacterium]|jgi:hypothetical protein|nr:hypothetical protein [Endomicrobiaceae bacterium]
MKKIFLGLIAVAVLLTGAVSVSQAQVFKLSLWGDICIPNESKTGGLELAIGTQTQEVIGVQLAFIYAQADELVGLQSALVSMTNNGQGVQWSFVNLADKFQGAQLSAVNWSKDVTGFQLSWVNNAESINGLQIGFVNIAGQMKGLQIGLVNIIKNNYEFFPVFPFFNFCF